MESAIVARQAGLDNKIASKRAKRYIFYPTGNIDMSGTQSTTPVWTPKIPQNRIVLFEPFEYYTQIGEETTQLATGGVKLELEEMGTDAQVRFMLDTFGEKGLVAISSLTNVEPEIAVRVEELIYPDGTIPKTLDGIQEHLFSLSFDSADALQELAQRVVAEIQEGVDRAIAWVNVYCNTIEREIQSSRAGRAGRPSLNNTDRYYYTQIGRRTPRDNDLNFGADTGLEALRGLLGNQVSPVQEDLYKETIEKQQGIIASLSETLSQVNERLSALEKPKK